MNLTDDLSWSGIVDNVQGDKEIGSEMLVSMANEKEQLGKEILDLEIELQSLKTRQLQIRKGALLVLKHLKLTTPLTVKQKDFVVVVSEDDLVIDRNVL